MRTLILAGLMIVSSLPEISRTVAHAGDTIRCITKEDAEFRRLITTCSDGSRAISR
jgi:hypothetical protein